MNSAKNKTLYSLMKTEFSVFWHQRNRRNSMDMSPEVGCTATPESRTPTMRTRLRRYCFILRRWLYLNIWCRHCYRHVMKLMHRFNLHYAPPTPLNPKYGEIQHWCQWCGLRGSTYKPDPTNGLKTNEYDRKS